LTRAPILVQLAPIDDFLAWLHARLGDTGFALVSVLVLGIILLILLAVIYYLVFGYED
jgi:hypothetical protein